MPSISSGLVATACASSDDGEEAAEREDQRQRVLAGAKQERAAEAEQRQADDLQHAGHDQLPGRHHRRGAPHPLLAVDERRRQHRAAGHRGRQRIAGIERGLGTPLPHLDARPTAAACAGSGRSCASTPSRRRPRPAPTTSSPSTGSSTPWRADPTPAPTRRPARSPRRAMITQRSHQYLPRAGRSWPAGRAPAAVASSDASYRVTAPYAGKPLRGARNRRSRRCRRTARGRYATGMSAGPSAGSVRRRRRSRRSSARPPPGRGDCC